MVIAAKLKDNISRFNKKWLFACMLSCFNHSQLFVILWTVVHQAPLSMGFSTQEYWSGFSCPPPRSDCLYLFKHYFKSVRTLFFSLYLFSPFNRLLYNFYFLLAFAFGPHCNFFLEWLYLIWIILGGNFCSDIINRIFFIEVYFNIISSFSDL